MPAPPLSIGLNSFRNMWLGAERIILAPTATLERGPRNIRAGLLADTETAEDLAQQILRGELAGDGAERRVRKA